MNVFSGHKFFILKGKSWLCEVGTCIKLCNSEESLALIKEVDGSWSLLSKLRVNEECIGPYAVLVFDPTGPETIGFLATITRILAEEKIPILAYSSYGRDYVLVPYSRLEEAVKALMEYGFVLKSL